MRGPRRRCQSGFVLIVVMGMSLALSVLVVGFHRQARAQLDQAQRMRLSQQAHNHAQSGLQVAIAAVREMDSPDRDHRSAQSAEQRTLTLEEGTCTVTLHPASSRLNINLLTDAQGNLNRPAIDQFLRLIDLVNVELPAAERVSYGLAADVIDWTDEDEDRCLLPFVKGENRGVESAYYRSLNPPYACPNRPFQTLGELCLVKGVSPVAFERLRSHITIKGNGLINVNHASATILQTLGPEFDGSVAALIVERRKTHPFTSLSELRELPGISAAHYQALSEYGTVEETDEYFHVQTEAEIGPVRRGLRSLIKRNRVTHNVDVIQYEEVQQGVP